jgi:hypothetical protein
MPVSLKANWPLIWTLKFDWDFEVMHVVVKVGFCKSWEVIEKSSIMCHAVAHPLAPLNPNLS